MATGVDAKLLKSTKFPPIFNQKVDMQKVNLQVMKKWIAGKIADILGNDDDVVIELCYNLIESARNPDIKSLQIQLTGFLESQTPEFCKELWALLLSAQASPQGIPRELLEAKKMELIQEKIEAEKAAEEARRKRNDFGRFDRDRPPRGGDRGDSWRGGASRGRRGNDNRRGGGSFGGSGGASGGRGPGRDRSLTPLGLGRDFRDRGGNFRPPQHDLYVPSDRRGRGGGRRDDYRRRRSPSRSPSYSRPRSRSSLGDSGSSYSRSRSRSRSYSRSPPRGDKRARSPPQPQRGGRRDGEHARLRSPSASRSPAAKRRRYSPSQSRSRDRGRRSARSVSSTGSSRYSRNGNSRSPLRRRRGAQTRSRSHSSSGSNSLSSEEDKTGRLRTRHSSPERGRGNGRNSGGGDGGDARRGGPTGKRRQPNSSSISSHSRSHSRSRPRSHPRSRDKSADVFSKDDKLATTATAMSAAAADATASKPMVTSNDGAPHTARRSQAKTAERLANEQREKELRERIKQMRSSKPGRKED